MSLLLLPQHGVPIAEQAAGYRAIDQPAVMELITPGSPVFSASRLILPSNGVTSAAWNAANNPVALPFILPRNRTVYQLGWVNGSSAGDNADVGIYSGDGNWTRLVSTGSTTGTGNSLVQFVDVTDTALTAGTLYYAVMCRDTTTANRTRMIGSINPSASALAGQMTTTTASFPLPNPLTNMVLVSASGAVPLVILALRSLV